MFARDRDRLRFLCQEIARRVEGETNQYSIGPVVSIAEEIADTEIARNLGFRVHPLLFIGANGVAPFDTLCCFDPFEPRGATILLTNAPPSASLHDRATKYRRDLQVDRGVVVQFMEAWLRAIDGLPEPHVYPAMYDGLDPTVAHGLLSDPFWRSLRWLAFVLQSDTSVLRSPAYATIAANNIRRVNRLATDAGLVSRKVFESTHDTLWAFDPAGGDPTIVRPNPFVEPKAARSPQGGMAMKCIQAWQAWRAASLARRARSASIPATRRRVGTREERQTPAARKVAWTSEAMVLVSQEPHLTNREIAARVGIDPSQLSRSKQFKAGRKQALESGTRPQKGRIVRKKDGTSEAEAEVDADE